MNLTRKGKKDHHNFLNLQESTPLLQALLQVCLLSVRRKAIHFPVIRRAKPMSDRADQMVEYCGPFLAGDFCERTRFPASHQEAALGNWSKGSRLRHSRKKKNLLACFRGKEDVLSLCKNLYRYVNPSMWIHAGLSCCAAITNVFCALQTCLRFAHLSMWSDHHGSTAEPFWLLMEEAFLAWSRCEIIPPNIFAMVSQTQLHCLSFPTGQEHSRGQSSQCSCDMRILILKDEQQLEKQKTLSTVSAEKENKPQTCLNPKLVH